MDKRFYITTPIYYPSAKPHMGHAYSSIIADFFARFKRMDGFEVQFLTGTDEHGLKIQRSAEKQNIDPLEFCNQISQTFRDLSKTLNLTNTDFIRTTEERHKKTVQHLWNELEKNDDIYLSKYSGWYSVSDEAFYNDDEIEDIDNKKVAISSKSPVEWVDEESYFFRLSKWEKPLLDFYEKNPDFILPETRKNEVISFVKSGLKDLSVSRKSFSGGIKVPNDDQHVIYVWLDALTNYISALNFPDIEDKKYKNFWPADLHIIGKDILRFHAVFWPAFLLAAKLPLPKRVFGHAWILSDDKKMSKSLGNGIDANSVLECGFGGRTGSWKIKGPEGKQIHLQANKIGSECFRLWKACDAQVGDDFHINPEESEKKYCGVLTKLFNVARFASQFEVPKDLDTCPDGLAVEDEWILAEFQATMETVKNAWQTLDIYTATQALKTFGTVVLPSHYPEKITPRVYDDNTTAALTLNLITRAFMSAYPTASTIFTHPLPSHHYE